MNSHVSVKEAFLKYFCVSSLFEGLSDNGLREQLLQAENTSLDNIVTKALTIEASRLDSRIISNNNAVNDQQINKVSFQRRSPERHQLSRNRSKSRINLRELGIDNLCLRCGATSHRVKECRSDASKFKCNGCSKTGHIQKVCIKTLLQANRSDETNHVDNESDDRRHF